MHVWVRPEPYTHKERGQEQPNCIIAKFGLSSTSATSGCTVPQKCYTVCTTLCLTAFNSRPPSHTICLFLHSRHLRPHLTHFSPKFLNIGVNDLSGSHHQSTARTFKRLLRSLWSSTTTVTLQRPRTVDMVSFPGGSWLLSRQSDNPS